MNPRVSFIFVLDPTIGPIALTNSLSVQIVFIIGMRFYFSELVYYFYVGSVMLVLHEVIKKYV